MATNILAIIDPEEETHSALNRIREIPPTADVVYKVDFYLDAVPVMAEEATPGVIKDAIAKHAEWLEELVAPLGEPDLAFHGRRAVQPVVIDHDLVVEVEP